MELIFVITVIFCLGFFLGWRFREVHAKIVVEKYQEEYIESLKKDVINIKVEDSDGTFFVYKKEDGSYIAHGENMTKLEDILNEKYPGKRFNATPEDLKKLNTR